MISSTSPITVRQTVTLAGRILCVFFLFHAVVNFAGIPSSISGMRTALEVVHSLQRIDTTSADYRFLSRSFGQYIISICISLFWGMLELWIARVFYRCGPRVTKFLLGDELAPANP